MAILFILVFTWITAESANILALFPLPFYSHTNTFMPVLKELAFRGHNLTMVSPFPQKERLQNWTDIVIDKKPYEKIMAKGVQTMTQSNKYTLIINSWKLCADVMETAYKDNNFQKLIKDNTLRFDLVITEPLAAQESLVAFGHKLNAPVVGFHPISFAPWAGYISGNPFFPSYMPNFRTTYTDHMTFLQRLDNTVTSIIEIMSGVFYYLPMQETYVEKYMIYTGSKNCPPLLDMLKNISLYLVDSHFSVGYAQAIQPNIVPIGGLSLKSAEKLPQDLQTYMDDSVNGVIYLSFGSLVQVSSLDTQILNAILSTFRSLDVKILMKWENDTLKSKPPNVELRKWLPQPSILAHPNCRLFISHGGLHSISEAAYHGVPLIGIPFFGDQEFNMKFVESAGFGLTLKKEDITHKTFQSAVELVLGNKLYKENALRRSQIIKDRPQSALDTAVYWIEYVLRHKDVSHLRAASANLPFYKLYLVDVFLVLVLSVILIVFTVCSFCRIFIKLICSSKSQHNVRKKED